MEYFNAFLCGGILCLIGQLLIDKTPLTPAKILVLYVVTGVVLGGAGVYQKLVDWAGSGATVPLTGFGYLLAKGVRKAVEEQGFLGALTGGVLSMRSCPIRHRMPPQRNALKYSISVTSFLGHDGII